MGKAENAVVAVAPVAPKHRRGKPHAVAGEAGVEEVKAVGHGLGRSLGRGRGIQRR